MKVQDVMDHMETLAPLADSEDFDNTGLLIGDPQMEVTGVLVTLDTLEIIVDEAIDAGCNLIVSFHPIIFKGLKSITGKNYVERVVMKALANKIAIFAIHTALDNAWHGVNGEICNRLGLNDRSMLIPKAGSILKLTTFVPKEAAENVRTALFEAGAGAIGNYDHCSFNIDGTGTFNGNGESNPTKGEKGTIQQEEEVQIGVVLEARLKGRVMKSLMQAHPYEEVAYELITLNNANQKLGMGMIGSLPNEMDEQAFLKLLKTTFKSGCIKHSALRGKKVNKVAVLGGSGAFAIGAAKAAGADFYVTADLKYHDFFQAEGQLVLADIGHYESEQFTKDLIVAHLSKKFTNFALVLSQKNTNPITYY